MTPAWHDVPPVPGTYQVLIGDGKRDAFYIAEPEHWMSYTKRGWHFYGPLPDPPPLPEPPKPPRFFTATSDSGEQCHGFVRDNTALIFSGTRHSATVRANVLHYYCTDIRWYAPETA